MAEWTAATATLGCPISYYDPWNDPMANRYWPYYLVVLVLLLAGFTHWRHVCPRPLPLLRVYMLCASAIAIILTAAQTIVVLDWSADDRCFLILQAGAAVTAGLYVEILTAARERRRMRIAKACARIRRLTAHRSRREIELL